MKEWRVVVHFVGDIGSVVEKDEELARCAALHKYGEEGLRPKVFCSDRPENKLYEDDTFDVRPA